MLAEQYWSNKSFNNNSIIEMLVDGNIEVVEILKSKNYVQKRSDSNEQNSNCNF